MRISKTLIVQLIESNPPEVVILNEVDQTEITLNTNEVVRLATALNYFLPAMKD